MNRFHREELAHWAIVTALLAPGVGLWIVGLTLWEPARWFALMAAAAVAVAQLWRRAARPIPTGGEQ